jgi:hypothetical protein
MRSNDFLYDGFSGIKFAYYKLNARYRGTFVKRRTQWSVG